MPPSRYTIWGSENVISANVNIMEPEECATCEYVDENGSPCPSKTNGKYTLAINCPAFDSIGIAADETARYIAELKILDSLITIKDLIHVLAGTTSEFECDCGDIRNHIVKE